MRLGKSGVVVAPAGPRLLPRGGSPSPAPSLPSSAPSRQERSLPIPSSAPCPARGEVARGRGPGPAPEPPLSVLCSSASIPGACPTSGPGNPPGAGPPAPEHRSERDSAPFPQPPWMCGLVPPQPCALSPRGTSRGIPGSAVAVGGCRWPGSLPCRPPPVQGPRCPVFGGLSWDVPPSRCSPCPRLAAGLGAGAGAGWDQLGPLVTIFV